MTNAAIRSTVFAVLIMGSIVGCSSQGPATGSTASGPIAARDKLIADVRQCSQRYGYDPNRVQGIGEHALAPQELEWRQCAYGAARVYERANPAVKSQYEQLIAEDIEMTTALQQGTITRSQRRARIEALIAQIKSAEETQAKVAATEQDRQMEQIRNVVDSARTFAY